MTSDAPTSAAPSSLGTCESCGADDERLIEIRRVYVTPEAWDTEATIKPAADTERWCGACLLHYPHQPIDS